MLTRKLKRKKKDTVREFGERQVDETTDAAEIKQRVPKAL